VQALNLFRQRTGSRQYFRIHLEKVVPHGVPPGQLRETQPSASRTLSMLSTQVNSRGHVIGHCLPESRWVFSCLLSYRPSVMLCPTLKLQERQACLAALCTAARRIARAAQNNSANVAGAGLGGGSGNAATTLWAANEAAGRPATNAQLLEWAGDIGSDISVFFSQGAAYCTGRYER